MKDSTERREDRGLEQNDNYGKEGGKETATTTSKVGLKQQSRGKELALTFFFLLFFSLFRPPLLFLLIKSQTRIAIYTAYFRS
jgi:hypothetical protein